MTNQDTGRIVRQVARSAALSLLLLCAAGGSMACGLAELPSASVLESGARKGGPNESNSREAGVGTPSTVAPSNNSAAIVNQSTRMAGEVGAPASEAKQGSSTTPPTVSAQAPKYSPPNKDQLQRYLVPAAEFEDDKDALQNLASDYKASKEMDSSPEQKLWFISTSTQLLFDQEDASTWGEARSLAVNVAYLDCLGQYATWLQTRITAELERKVESSGAQMPALAREFYGSVEQGIKEGSPRWSKDTIKSTIESESFNHVGGLAVNKIFWGKHSVVVVCVVTETTRKLQAYCRGAIPRTELPKLEPLSHISELVKEKEEILPMLNGGVFYWIDDKGQPFVYCVGSTVQEDLEIEDVVCKSICDQQLAFFMGAQVAKREMVKRAVESARSSTVSLENGESAKQAIVKSRSEITKEIKALGTITLSGWRKAVDRTTRFDGTRIKNEVWVWTPTEQELAELRKKEQDQLKKFGGRDPGAAGNAAGAGGAKREEDKRPPPAKKNPAPNGKGDSGRGVD